MIRAAVSWLLGGGVNLLLAEWRELRRQELEAENDAQRLHLQREQTRVQAAIEMARLANDDRWSATSIGRYLIVVPFGIWWTAIFIDSIFAFEWDVLALPPDIMDLSVWLVPAIVVADAGRIVFKRR